MPLRTVLVVDPRAGVRSSVRHSLPQEDYRILSAKDGLQALTTCLLRPVDLLLIAPNLPGIGSRAVSEKLAGPFPDTPVLELQDHEENLRERVQEALARRPAASAGKRALRQSA